MNFRKATQCGCLKPVATLPLSLKGKMTTDSAGWRQESLLLQTTLLGSTKSLVLSLVRGGLERTFPPKQSGPGNTHLAFMVICCPLASCSRTLFFFHWGCFWDNHVVKRVESNITNIGYLFRSYRTARAFTHSPFSMIASTFSLYLSF